jgi:hypothetical protein
VPPQSPALFYLSAAAADLPIQGCSILVDPNLIFFAAATQANNNGAAMLRFAFPDVAALIGATAYAQWFDVDSKSTNLKLIGGGAATSGAKLVLGR